MLRQLTRKRKYAVYFFLEEKQTGVAKTSIILINVMPIEGRMVTLRWDSENSMRFSQDFETKR